MLNKQILVEAVGLKRGRFTNKANRIAKLIENWPSLESKMIGFIQRGNGWSEQARLAYATLLMMETGIRTGNESSAEGWVSTNQIVAKKDNPDKGIKAGDVIWRHPLFGQHVATYGLTTLKHSHVKKRRNKVYIDFVGKKLVDQSLVCCHPILVQYLPTGKPADLFLGISYHELKKFVKRSVGRNFVPKDLRMTKVNLIFIDKFEKQIPQFEAATTKSARKKILADTIEDTANVIGHTKGVCRSAYLSQPLLSFLTNQEIVK